MKCCDRCDVKIAGLYPDDDENEDLRLRPTTLCTLNPHGQLSGYFENARSPDLCVSCRAAAEAVWNDFAAKKATLPPTFARELIGDDLGYLRERLERLGALDATTGANPDFREFNEIIDGLFVRLADLELTLVPVLAPGFHRLDDSPPGTLRADLIADAGVRSAERKLWPKAEAISPMEAKKR